MRKKTLLLEEKNASCMKKLFKSVEMGALLLFITFQKCADLRDQHEDSNNLNNKATARADVTSVRPHSFRMWSQRHDRKMQWPPSQIRLAQRCNFRWRAKPTSSCLRKCRSTSACIGSPPSQLTHILKPILQQEFSNSRKTFYASNNHFIRDDSWWSH